MRHCTEEELEKCLNRSRGRFCPTVFLRRLHLRNCPECRSRFRHLVEDDRFLADFVRELDEYRRRLGEFSDSAGEPERKPGRDWK